MPTCPNHGERDEIGYLRCDRCREALRTWMDRQVCAHPGMILTWHDLGNIA